LFKDTSSPSYALLFPGKIAQPWAEVEVKQGELEMKVYYSLCTQKQQLLFAANYTDCETGNKQICEANGVPLPCRTCEKGNGVYFPEDTFLIDFSKALLQVVTQGGMMFGCEKQGGGNLMDCQAVYEAFPFDWGIFECRTGSRCIDSSSGLGAAVNDTGLKNDFDADDALTVVYLVLGTTFLFIVGAAIVVFAWMYKFQTRDTKRISRIEFKGVTLAWEDLSVGDLIVNLQGHAGPGAFKGVLGPIGAGKSTLLKVLSGRITPTAGTVSINGKEASAGELRRTVGFVPQEDFLCHDDTVAEAIGFATAMSYGQFPDVHRVLKDKLNQRIGALSGGQRRMTTIYVELARQPKALILDEPTTGLDSDSAREIVQMLKEVSATIPVLATLHQPRPEVSAFLDEVLVLADGEEMCHAGRLHEGVSVVHDLKALIAAAGHDAKSQSENVLDVAIDFAYEGVRLGRTESLTKRSAEAGAEFDTQPSVQSVHIDTLYRPYPSVARQLLFLGIRKTKRALRRSPAKYAVTLAATLFAGFCYFQVDNTLNGVRNRFGAIFMAHSFVALQAVGATSETIKAVIFTEHEICSYVYLRAVDALITVLGQTLSQIPHGLIVSVIIYLMVGLRSDGSRPIVFCISLTACTVCLAYTALVGRMRSQTYIGLMRATAVNGLMLFYCGFLLTKDNVNIFEAISPLNYSFEMLMAHELIGLRTLFNPYGSRPFYMRGGLYLKQYDFVTKLDDEFDELGRSLGIVCAFWMLVAFMVLLIPPHIFDPLYSSQRCRRQVPVGIVPCFTSFWSAPVRVKGHGQLDILLRWVWDTVLPSDSGSNGTKGDEVPHAAFVGVADASTDATGGEKIAQPDHDNSGGPADIGESVEMLWTGIGNPDAFDLQGGLRTGTMLGIVGPCGSGKTTLLTMLTGRVRPASGQICVGGKAMSPQQLAGMVGYVPQFHNLHGYDTLREALAFAEEVDQLASKSSVALKKYCVGNQGEQRIGILSQGQQKIASVAVELVRRPMLLALDEPMSGLDGTSSLKLAHLLKRISQTIPVAVTLHQPRPELAKLFTHFMVMHRGKLCVSLPYDDLCTLSAQSSKAGPDGKTQSTGHNDEASGSAWSSAGNEDERPVDQVLTVVEEFF
jgi:ABC-type multidrug transport system ATPase subunit/ABC-type multidrug transport system permease subunit